MRHFLQACMAGTLICAALALGCRNSQTCCRPACCPTAQPSGSPASPSTLAEAAAGSPAQPTGPSPGTVSPPASATIPPAGTPASNQTNPGPMPLLLGNNTAPAASVPQVVALPTPAPAPAALTAPGLMNSPSSPLPAGAAPTLPQTPSATPALQGSQEDSTLHHPPTVPTAGQPAGHDASYRWLEGVLDYVAIQHGWVLHYSPVGDEDRYGGCVTLTGTGAMGPLKRGQRVRVTGELFDPSTTRPRPVYRIYSLQPLPPS